MMYICVCVCAYVFLHKRKKSSVYIIHSCTNVGVVIPLLSYQPNVMNHSCAGSYRARSDTSSSVL